MGVSDRKVHNNGDGLDLLLCLNQDTTNRHLRILGPSARAVFNGDTIKPGNGGEGVQLCPIPVNRATGNSKNKLAPNTMALGVITCLFGLEFQVA